MNMETVDAMNVEPTSPASSATSETARPATRRSHTKSRTGCKECKRRKVKCDERLPTCFNCFRRGATCSLKTLVESPHESRPVRPAAEYPDAGPKTVPAQRRCSPQPWSALPGPPLPDFSGRGIELMHHYSTITADTLAHKMDMQHVWRMIVPQLSYAQPFLCHGLLAIAALHKAHLVPSMRDEFVNMAAYHQARGMEGFRRVLPFIDDSNWMPAFSYSSTVIIQSFSVLGRTGDILSDVLKLFVLVRGIRSSLRSRQSEVSNSPLSPWARGVWIMSEELELPLDHNPPVEQSVLPLDVFKALRRLFAFYRTSLRDSSRTDYEFSTMLLLKAAALLAQAGPQAEIGMVMFIPYSIPGSVMCDIEERNPYALLLLSHFALLLSCVERSFWYVEGWSKSLLSDIKDHLSPNKGFWKIARWPNIVVNRCLH